MVMSYILMLESLQHVLYYYLHPTVMYIYYMCVLYLKHLNTFKDIT